ncbi:hypothetical protein BT63DRAFT_460724 [Microthyrium microscopicum]|uniref:Uncharacterized protein n=1 Tax=Microthyrium microscopicum TaxID=703497 RepID=A0A6A6TUV6_9PEZI|nr:hypothetical protein BT63DRAFT_460724 [Microthyrium microscopicum]
MFTVEMGPSILDDDIDTEEPDIWTAYLHHCDRSMSEFALFIQRMNMDFKQWIHQEILSKAYSTDAHDTLFDTPFTASTSSPPSENKTLDETATMDPRSTDIKQAIWDEVVFISNYPVTRLRGGLYLELGCPDCLGNAYTIHNPDTGEINYEFLKGEYDLTHHLRIVHNRQPVNIHGRAILQSFDRNSILKACAVRSLRLEEVGKILPIGISDKIHPEVLKKEIAKEKRG